MRGTRIFFGVVGCWLAFWSALHLRQMLAGGVPQIGSVAESYVIDLAALSAGALLITAAVLFEKRILARYLGLTAAALYMVSTLASLAVILPAPAQPADYTPGEKTGVLIGLAIATAVALLLARQSQRLLKP